MDRDHALTRLAEMLRNFDSSDESEIEDTEVPEGVKLHTNGRMRRNESTSVRGDVFQNRSGTTECVEFVEPLSPHLNYFEYLILDTGRIDAIGIGCGQWNYSLSDMPGWGTNSCGYHADDGKLYHAGAGRVLGPKCTTGDRMGCGVYFDCDIPQGLVEVFFTKNGKQVGERERMQMPVRGIYPLIGLHSLGDKVLYLGHWKLTAQEVDKPMMGDNKPHGETKLHEDRLINGPTVVVNKDVFSFLRGEVGVVKFLEPLSPSLNYFEYIIVSRGQGIAIVGIGCGERDYPLSRMPGWNRNSCGYHADDGNLFQASGRGRAFGPTCTVGDRMGCGIMFDSNPRKGEVKVFFTKNGKAMGDLEKMKMPVDGIYPLIGLHSVGAKVRYLGHWKRTAEGVREPKEQHRSGKDEMDGPSQHVSELQSPSGPKSGPPKRQLVCEF